MTDETKHAPAGSQDLLVRRWHGIRLRQYRKNTMVLLYCPNRHESNPERIEVGMAWAGQYYADGTKVTGTWSHHAWASHWAPLPNPPNTKYPSQMNEPMTKHPLASSDGSADFVAWCDERHGYCVWSQPSRGEYKVIAGPFVTSDEARAAALPASTGSAWRCSVCGHEWTASPPTECPSCAPEAWWTRHASLLAEKMRRGGVRKFRVELTPRGTYEFEVDPIESPNTV